MGTNYYLETQPCETCGHISERKHIGKQSYGWSFHFRAHDDINSYKEWLAEFDNPRKVIRDEYGEIISKDKFIEMVEATKDKMNHWRILSGSLRTPKEKEYLERYPYQNYPDYALYNFLDNEGHAFDRREFS